MKTVFIQLTTIGADTGPTFDLFSDHDSFGSVFDGDISEASLASGYTCTVVPDDCTIIRVKSRDNEVCQNYIDISIQGLTTTTSTSVLPTTTSTTTATPVPSIYYVMAGGGEAFLASTVATGQTFLISFSYRLEAFVNNLSNPGSSNSNEVALEVSTNGGSGWTTQDSVTAYVSSGPGSTDTQSVTGTFSVAGITNLYNVRIRITGDCGANPVGLRQTEGYCLIGTVLPSAGSANVGSPNRYNAECVGGVLTRTLDTL